MQLFLLLILHIHPHVTVAQKRLFAHCCCVQQTILDNIWWTNARMKNCISENKSAPAAHSEWWPDANAGADCCCPAASCPNLNNLVFYFYFQQTDYKLYKLTVWGNGNFPPRWWDVWHEESDSNILKPGINVDSSYKIVDLKVNGLLVTPNIITDLWVATDLSKIETK